MKTLVVFQGGGALGAYACGAWTRLAPGLREQGHTVVALAGGSIGALNAAVVAHHWHDGDLGVGALQRLWHERIATPSLPFLGPAPGDTAWARRLRSWNGLLSGMLMGTRGLYVPQFGAWNPWDGLRRLERPLFDRQRMHALVADETPGYASAADPDRPLLAVSASELMRGELHLFDSDAAAIGPAHVLASSALPLLFEPVPLDGGLYWDGEIVRPSLLRQLVARVRASGRAGPREPLLLVTLEQLPRELAAPPRSGVEIAYRTQVLVQADKLGEDELTADAGIARWWRITRDALPHDAVSGQFDYSPERIDELIAQGHAAADAAVYSSAERRENTRNNRRRAATRAAST